LRLQALANPQGQSRVMLLIAYDGNVAVGASP
jgi:hypothetical protein